MVIQNCGGKQDAFKTLFTWSGGPRSSGVGFSCFMSPRAKQKKLTPLDRGSPLHVNRPLSLRENGECNHRPQKLKKAR